MAQRMFFWAHNHPECGAADESKSKSNHEEAEMVVRLVRHLLLQVLAHVTGPLLFLCAKRAPHLENRTVCVNVNLVLGTIVELAPTFHDHNTGQFSAHMIYRSRVAGIRNLSHGDDASSICCQNLSISDKP